MYGNTGENVYFTSISFSAEYGQTYHYSLTGDIDAGYKLEEIKKQNEDMTVINTMLM